MWCDRSYGLTEHFVERNRHKQFKLRVHCVAFVCSDKFSVPILIKWIMWYLSKFKSNWIRVNYMRFNGFACRPIFAHEDMQTYLCTRTQRTLIWYRRDKVDCKGGTVCTMCIFCSQFKNCVRRFIVQLSFASWVNECLRFGFYFVSFSFWQRIVILYGWKMVFLYKKCALDTNDKFGR